MELSDQISICLAVIRGPISRQYGGRGVSRRREAGAARMMAEAITANIMIAYTFDGADETSLKRVIEDTLKGVPDAVAHAYADRLAMISDPARHEIADLVAAAIEARWPVKYTPANPPLHKF